MPGHGDGPRVWLPVVGERIEGDGDAVVEPDVAPLSHDRDLPLSQHTGLYIGARRPQCQNLASDPAINQPFRNHQLPSRAGDHEEVQAWRGGSLDMTVGTVKRVDVLASGDEQSGLPGANEQ
ncbi:MAG TPA: hypothetical protein VGR16_13010 [Thermomicrobiales bacterium]|nr:hypothetical protein [Thermomicrobiales bacterium]